MFCYFTDSVFPVFQSRVITWEFEPPKRNHKSASGFQLFQQFLRNIRSSSSNQYAVKRSIGWQSLVSVAIEKMDAGNSTQLSRICECRYKFFCLSMVYTLAPISASTAAWYPEPVPTSSTFCMGFNLQQFGLKSNRIGL